MKLEGKAQILRIHFGEDDKWQNKPLYLRDRREMPRAGYRRRHRIARNRGLRRQHPRPSQRIIFPSRPMRRSWSP